MDGTRDRHLEEQGPTRTFGRMGFDTRRLGGSFFFYFKRKKSKERETVRIGKDVFDSIGSDLGVKEKKKRWYARVTKKGIRTCSCAHESMGSEASSWELFACGILLSASLYLYTLYVVEPWLRKR